MTTLIGTVRKTELRDLLTGLSLTTPNPDVQKAFQIVAYATGLGELSLPTNTVLILEQSYETNEIDVRPLSTGRCQNR